MDMSIGTFSNARVAEGQDLLAGGRLGSGGRVGVMTVGMRMAAISPRPPMAASTIRARPYPRSGVVVIPATRMVPAIAVPIDEPRLDRLRDSPEISPCWASPKLDCTTFTDGVSINPRPS